MSFYEPPEGWEQNAINTNQREAADLLAKQMHIAFSDEKQRANIPQEYLFWYADYKKTQRDKVFRLEGKESVLQILDKEIHDIYNFIWPNGVGFKNENSK